MKKIILALSMVVGLSTGYNAYAQEQEVDVGMEAFAPLKQLINALNEGNIKIAQESVAKNATEIQSTLQEEFAGKEVLYGLDCESPNGSWEVLSPQKVKMTCSLAAEAERWNVSGISTYFVVEQEEDGIWRIAETDFHEKGSEKNALAFMGKIFGILGFAFLVIFGGGGIFWILMVRDCIKRDFPQKTTWIFVLIFLNIIGALAYYFMVKRKDKKDALLRPSTKK